MAVFVKGALLFAEGWWSLSPFFTFVGGVERCGFESVGGEDGVDSVGGF